MGQARKGMAIDTIGMIVLALVALAVLMFVLTKLSPALSKFAGAFGDKIKSSICDKFGFVRSLLCRAVI